MTNMETVTVEILDRKAYRLLEDLAELNIIRLHQAVTLDQNAPLGERKFGFAKEMIH